MDRKGVFIILKLTVVLHFILKENFQVFDYKPHKMK